MTRSAHGPDATEPNRSRWYRHPLAVISEIAAILGVVVALLAWWYPRTPDPRPTGPVSATSTAPQGGQQTPADAAPRQENLDSLVAVEGRPNLTTLPRELTGTAADNHPVVIRCPTNQTTDLSREVTFALDGRYLTVAAQVTVHFESNQDRRVDVEAVVGTRQPDGQLSTEVKGASRGVTAGDTGATLTADLEEADQLTLRVTCERPGGVVILVGAVTRAP